MENKEVFYGPWVHSEKVVRSVANESNKKHAANFEFWVDGTKIRKY